MSTRRSAQMSGIVSLIDNKLLKLPDETIPLGAISSISTNYEVPHKVIGILLVIIGGLIAYNSGNVTDESRLAAAWGGVIIFAIGFGLIHIRRHFLLIN